MGEVMPDNTAADYRQMAERALAMADRTKDPAIRASLIDIAARYAWMGDWVENHAGTSRSAGAAAWRKPDNSD